MMTKLEYEPTVVVIDDEESLREGCRQTLEAEGYRTAVAQDGMSGLKLVEEMKPNVVLIDLRLPGMGGMEVLGRVRDIDPEIVSIIITAYGTIESAVQAIKIGAYDYIEKPLTPEQITDMIDRVISVQEPEPEKETQLPEKDDGEAFVIKLILRKAAANKEFGRNLLYDGQHELAGWALSRDAANAIVSGNEAWITKRCGALSAEEREWFEKKPW